MADSNAIDLIVAEKAFQQLQDLITGLKEVDTKVADTVKKANDQFKNMSSINTPSLSGDNSAQMAKVNQELKETIELAKKYEAQIKLLLEAKQKYNREVTQDSVNAVITRRNATQEFQATSKLISEYDRLDLAHKKAMKSAQAIGAEFGSTSKKFLEASVATNKLGDELKAIDATLGKNNRNVGNYKSGFNGLSNSINQLTREAPAFANSIGTGFMALSNNIPILADEIANLRQKNLDLAKSGQPTQSMFKTITSSLLSWQTALSVGVTLLTLYGERFIDYAFGLSEAEKAQKSFNEEVEKTKYTVDKEAIQLKVLTNIVNDNTKSSKQRKIAYDEIKEVLPGLTSQTYENAIATGELSRVTDLYTASLIAKNVVEIKSKGIAERQSELDLKMSKTTKERLTFWEKVRIEYTAQGLTYADFTRRLSAQDKAEQKLIDNDIKLLNVDVLKSNALQNQIGKYTTKIKSTKDINKEEEKHIQLTTNSQNAIDENVKSLKEQLANVDKSSDAFRMLNGLIGLVEASTKNLSKLADAKFPKPELPTDMDFVPPVSKDQEDQTAWLKQYAKDQEEFLKKQEEIKKYIASFADEFASNSGLTETFKMLNGEIEGFGEKWQVTAIAIAESAQEMFNFISNASQQNFQAEYARLESQKEIAIGFAGDSAVAKDKIEKDAEKKKKEIANRENKAKQKQAIFNIAIDTAQAIIATLAKTPPPAGIPMALFVGALGAIQIGMVASQKIPQYFDGTDNHTGGLMLVNDGKGANYKEKVVLPNGQVILPQDRNVLMEAPKGTKVLNHEQQLFEMLQGKGVSMSVAQSQGMTADEMDMILAKHFSGIKTHNTTIDKNGFNSYIRNGNSITRMNSNRSQGIGLSV